ncbi:aminomethyl-transferring glycine dehydrogenase [Shewanella oneidensis MR-1]|uniref:Glycine dehydrogenase (decarboxylating) n=1 Tax=Shewanella oneidensis (strain ATCC 700550 / JCM 31522 / CIP 106686 / LMG 19005 / NCIMB 14063 / MR-1) TaxID=211586 RepID=GCSP_SHEON|nr:aminomethyl-transferring glycine dehydrogenase [Shewanella oneidensis]Q8EIQ6.1 RecName: Full=Glycine dehydrogenase (decarboxylating); AltName: Full=Glycine cleavage system P-protein; AltName: Full=Glycine decarboxylase; AltName: Full=Glycine dehydrogenase (aminomethyl-transferring) [Shewanella oneidensis MR-1]AAN53857.1 glycine dehydrogenase (decarboxylating) GcvP [Shewanella oneidensis MR-1]MDX5997311.1 aminomethyl-transferring glycine dehydrogenase [Shewanella oneidensis]MEE2029886.1 Glyci
MTKQTLTQLEQHDLFLRRHIGPDSSQQQEMLNYVGAESLDDLTAQIVPESIRLSQELSIGDSCGEAEGIAYIRGLAKQNQVFKSYIGMGYYGTQVPNVILRNVLENPGWYTAYTPYQPEIAQGRLEAILNFQQVSMDLTGLDLASASLLDEATAAAEAMALAKRVSKAKKANIFFVADDVFPQTLDVVKTRAECFGFEVVVGPASEAVNHELFGALFQYSNRFGQITDFTDLFAELRAKNVIVTVAADIMSLVLLKSPGSMGADVVFGSAQRFGVPMGFGGPHAAFFVARDEHKRSMPGRIIGVSKDTRGNRALRMAMQTREQHIRREKANSNICTAQILLANMASFYAVFHGPQGLKTIASRINRFADILAAGLQAKGVSLVNNTWFDTISIKGLDVAAVNARALAAEMNLRFDADGIVGVSLDETTIRTDIDALFEVILGAGHGLDVAALDAQIVAQGSQSIPASLVREDAILSHPTFNRYQSETEMMRYIKRLESKDLALNYSMISLGSCTMKLNAAVEMIPVSWPEFANMHPFCPLDQAKGYTQLIEELSSWLVNVTGYDAVCIQPNSGAQGEYAGLLAIRKYHESRGEAHRNICLIPQSAHGTNPASAQLAGMQVVVTACDKQGNVDLEDLKAKAAEVAENLSCIMITYPSTHGVYEETVREICNIVHQHGGQVYLDGANMNAQVGLTSPGFIGADVSHLNLHKTFAIPHGGGGPGMGPIGVKAHLAPFVAGHVVVKPGRESDNNGAVSAAPYGSAGILPISWMYIKLLGSKGLKKSTQTALLNANYVMKKLSEHYPVLFRGRNDRVAHECIIDLRPIKEASGVTEMDIAKRLNDYGFHAPTMSFPVAGTLMIEPTESESKVELDRFIDAMVSIRAEIAKVEAGEWPADNNPLHNAPHTMADIMDSAFDSRPYSREVAVFPSAAVRTNKFWPTVNRIDDVYGDRNLFCACVPLSDYE